MNKKITGIFVLTLLIVPVVMVATFANDTSDTSDKWISQMKFIDSQIGEMGGLSEEKIISDIGIMVDLEKNSENFLYDRQTNDMYYLVEARADVYNIYHITDEDDVKLYIIEEDENGVAHVKFSDGKVGSKLPDGLSSITATYRTDSGGGGNEDNDFLNKFKDLINTVAIDTVPLPDSPQSIIAIDTNPVPDYPSSLVAIDTVPLPDSAQSLVDIDKILEVNPMDTLIIDTVPLPDNPQSLVAIDTVPLPDNPQDEVAIGTWPTPEEEIMSTEDAIIGRENPVINPGEESSGNNKIDNPSDNSNNNIRNDINNLRDPERDDTKQNDVSDLNGQGFWRDINPWVQ